MCSFNGRNYNAFKYINKEKYKSNEIDFFKILTIERKVGIDANLLVKCQKYYNYL